MLFTAGDHVPIIPFKDVVTKGLIGAPEQIGATALNDGVIIGFTVINCVIDDTQVPNGAKV